MQLALVNSMPAQVKAWLGNCSGRRVACKMRYTQPTRLKTSTPLRRKYLSYGFGETVGRAFLLEISGSFVSLKLEGTVNTLSAIESRLRPVMVLVISVGWSGALPPWLSAGFALPTIMRIRIGSPGKSRKSGIYVLAASQNSDLID